MPGLRALQKQMPSWVPRRRHDPRRYHATYGGSPELLAQIDAVRHIYEASLLRADEEEAERAAAAAALVVD